MIELKGEIIFEKVLSQKQLAKLIYLVFAYENPLFLDKDSEYIISTIPLDIIFL